MKIAKLTFLYVIGAILSLVLFVWVGPSILDLNQTNEEHTDYQQLAIENKLQQEKSRQFEQTTTCEHYSIKEYQGKLAIYVSANQPASNKLLKITDIPINAIDQSITKDYLESLEFDSIEALENYLEGIVS